MSEGDYEVGYGKPPRHTRFKAGQSGNPGGRKTGARGLKTDLEAEMKSRGAIKINGQPVKGTKQQLMIRSLSERAALGDVRAARILLQLIVDVLGTEDRGVKAAARLTPNDELILQQFLAGENELASLATKLPSEQRLTDQPNTGADGVAGD